MADTKWKLQFVLPLFYAGFVSVAGMKYAFVKYMANRELIP